MIEPAAESARTLWERLAAATWSCNSVQIFATLVEWMKRSASTRTLATMSMVVIGSEKPSPSVGAFATPTWLRDPVQTLAILVGWMKRSASTKLRATLSMVARP